MSLGVPSPTVDQCFANAKTRGRGKSSELGPLRAVFLSTLQLGITLVDHTIVALIARGTLDGSSALIPRL